MSKTQSIPTYTCDICKAQQKHITLPPNWTTLASATGGSDVFDLCPDCFKVMKDKKAAKKEQE